MDDYRWGRATWTELAELGLTGAGRGITSPQSLVALLPVGAVEAHGPHLPLTTDVTIAVAAAESAAPGLARLGHRALILPSVSYTAASFAAGFPGTISVRPGTVTALILDIASSLEAQGVRALVLANAHLDPGHVASLAAAVETHTGTMPLLFPDISRKPWASRMTAEFKTGACHGGQYETSVVMAAAPESVRDDVRVDLPANLSSLSKAIRNGVASFEEAGVTDAYCGRPADATAQEGHQTIQILGQILIDAVGEAVG